MPTVNREREQSPPNRPGKYESEMRMDRGSEPEIGKADVGLAVILFAAALALRIPFRSQFAYHWDSAQFALAVGEYNVRISQPQAPGFYWYVMLGRLVNLVAGEPHAALVWLSVVAGASLVAAGYLLATSMFGRSCGLGTGLILLTSPLCWFHSEVALSTIVDAALVVGFVLVIWRATQRGVTWFQTASLAGLFAVVGGVRPQSAVLLVPLWGYILWGYSGSSRNRKILCSVALATGLCLFWLVPVIKSAGGLASFGELLRLKSQFDAPRIVWRGGGLGALLMDISCLGRACWVGLLGAAIISLMEFVHWVVFEEPSTKNQFYRDHKRQLSVLALWIIPMLLFDVLMYAALPGHVLNLFPAIVILASLGLVRFSRRLAALLAVGCSSMEGAVFTIVALLNIFVFVYSPRPTVRLLLGMDLTGVEIRRHDSALAACFQAIRERWPSKNVILYHRHEDFYWGFRQFQYHLPDYRNVLLDADRSLPGTLGTKKWLGYRGRTSFVDGLPIYGDNDTLLIVPPGESLDLFKSYFDLREAALISETGVKLYVLQQAPGKVFTK